MSSDKSINSNDLPQKDLFERKEVYQQKQPADTGKAMEEKPAEDPAVTAVTNDDAAPGKEEGLNEEKSKGNAGAFEGFEDHQQ